MIAFLLSLFLWISTSNVVRCNVIGLDFGSDSMKVALVQPGSPLEIVTNFQSKRKTPNSISFYRGERMFGSDSIALMARKPELTFSKAYRVLGRSADNPLSKELTTQYFPHEIYTNETTGFTCFKQEETFYTPEELVAMMMQHARDMTVNFGGKNIKDCVITVPSHFTHHERKALYTAAQIADLRVLTLMEENTAAALHYSMDRVFETPSTVLFFNMGASSVQVTIATFSSYTVKELGKNKTTSQFEVIGKGWDRSLGGFNFDVKLAELMALRFNEVWGKKKSGKDKDLRDFVRPMTRLRVEALKVKEVLSANNEYPVKLEQLHDDTDLVTKITRADYEQACADLFDRILEPINQALAFANMSVSEINSVELLGGSVRIPRVKKLLDDFFKPSNIELGQHLNGDEAMALGAAFRGANLSTSFKVRKVGQSDINNFGISIHLEALPTADQKSGFFGFFGGKDSKPDAVAAGDEVWTKDAEVFPKKLTLSSKLRTVTFPFDKDIVCKIAYTNTDSLPAGTDPTIAVLNITGVTEFSKEVAKKASSSPKVHLSFVLDSDGVVTLVKAEATSELPVVETLDDDSNVTADATTGDGNETAEDSSEENNSTSTDSKKSSKSDKKSSKKDKKAKKDNTLRRSLAVTENRLASQPPLWDDAHILESKAKLHALNLADDARKAKEAALNELEGYIYKVNTK